MYLVQVFEFYSPLFEVEGDAVVAGIHDVLVVIRYADIDEILGLAATLAYLEFVGFRTDMGSIVAEC